MALFKRKKTTASVAPKEIATVSVFFDADKTREMMGDAAVSQVLDYLNAQPVELLEYEHRGVTGWRVIADTNGAAVQIRETINGMVGLRSAAKLIAQEQLEEA